MTLRRLAALPLALAVALTTACAGDNTGEENITPQPVAAVNERPVDQLVDGGELRVPVAELGTSLNPLSANSSPAMDQARRAFLPTLFTVRPTGEVEPDANYLTSAEVTSPAGQPTQVTLKLNPEAVWADGTPITSADLVATWRACNGQVPQNQCRDDLGLDRIRDIVAVSDTEASVSFTEADPEWTEPFVKAGIVRASSVETPETFANGWNGEVPAEWTSGPFTPQTIDAEHGVISLGRNDAWWGTEARLQRLTIVQKDPAEYAQAFRRNDVDVLYAGTSADAFSAGVENPDAILRRGGGTETRTLVFNTESAGPTSDPGVRRAIARALDRSRVGIAALPDMEYAASALDNRIYLYGQTGYVDNAEATGMTRNVRKARGLLDDAGWKAAGDGTRSRDGQPLEIAMVRVMGDPVSEREVAEITTQLSAIGVRVVPEDVDPNAWSDGAALGAGTFQMAVVSQTRTAWPTGGLDARFAQGGDQNWSKLAVPEVETALEELNAEIDPNRRREIANHIDELLWDQVGTLPLYQVPESVFTRPRLANFGAHGVGTIEWNTVGFVA